MGAASRVLITAICLTAAANVAAFAQGIIIQVAPFNSVHVEHGAHVTVRPGAAHGVTLIKGSADYSRISVSDAGTLLIDKCRSKCPKGYDLEVEVVAPTLGRISVAQGGMIQVREEFPRRAQLALEVSNGGSIDARTIPADRVVAFIEHGGGILTVPGASLQATVIQGGSIMYWGDAQVRSSVQHGGMVIKGKPGELLLPTSEIGFSGARAR